jgi:hypothetical protein
MTDTKVKPSIQDPIATPVDTTEKKSTMNKFQAAFNQDDIECNVNQIET